MSNIWDAISRYLPGLLSRLNFTTSAINEPYNAITFEAPLRAAFGSFHFAFGLLVRPNNRLH